MQKAYLPKVRIEDKIGVALCLRTYRGPDRALATNIGTVFKGIFNAHEHLDIIFINPNQEIEVAQVCKPFF